MRLVARPVRFGFPALLCAVLLAPAFAVPQAEPEQAGAPAGEAVVRTLRAIDVPADDARRVVLKLDGPPRFTLFEVENPHRVVVDLEGTVSRLARNTIPVSSDLYARVRAGQYTLDPTPVARVVLDMKGQASVTARAEGSDLVLLLGSASSDATRPAKAPVAAPPPASAPPVVVEAPAPTPAEIRRAATPAEDATPEPVPAEPTEPAEPAETNEVTRLAVGSLPGAPPGTVKVLPLDEPTAAPEAGSPAAPVAPVVYEPSTTTLTMEAAEEGKDRPLGAAGFEAAPKFEKVTIAGPEQLFTGKKISLNLVDADIKQVFRLFHEISGLNFVLDPAVSGRVTIVVDDVPWDQALDLILKNNGLDKIYEGNVIRIATTSKLAQESAGRKALKEAKELEADTVTISRTLSYAKAQKVDAIIKTGVLLSPRGKSFYDDRTNTLIVTDVPTKIEPIDRLITSLDEKTTQVMIEARIVETTRNFVQDLGIRWGFSGERSPTQGNPLDWEFPHSASVNWDLNLARNPGISQLAFSFANLGDSFTLDIALDALESEGKARVLSAPKIATRNNEEAEIEQGVRIPIVNTTATEINVDFVSASLKLKATPQITAEGTVLLDLEVSNDTPELTIRGQGGTPGIRTQRAKTKVLVTDGGTTVIGGIFVINEGRSEFGVPFFRKLPFFGWLFKSRTMNSENRELLVFVTPKVIK